MKRLRRILLSILMTAVSYSSTSTLLADATWNGSGGADDRWSTDLNWVGGTAPPTSDGTATYTFDNTDLGNVNGVDQDWTVGYLYFVNDSLTQGHTTDLSNNTLVVRSLLRAGDSVPNTHVTIQNGTLQLGDQNLACSLYVGYNDAVNTDQTNQSLTITGTINASNMTTIVAGWQQNSDDLSSGTLDLSGTTIISPNGPNTLKLGGHLLVGNGSYNHNASAGVLKLPASLQSIEMDGSLVCGQGIQYSPKTYSSGIIDFGSGSALTSLTVRGNFHLMADGATGGELANLPQGTAVTIGQSGTPVTMHMAVTYAGSYGNTAEPAATGLTLTNRFTAYLTDLTLGFSSTYTVGNATGVLDVSEAAVQIGDTANKVTGLKMLRIGLGTHGYGMLRLPPTITEIETGEFALGSGGSKFHPADSTYSYYGGYGGWLDIGSNSQLQVLTVTNFFTMAGEQSNGRIGYQGPSGWVDYLPTGIVVTVGRPDDYVPMHLNTWTWSYGGNPATTGVLSIVNGVFTAYLTELMVGYATSYRGNGYAVLDCSTSDVQIGDTPDQVRLAKLYVAGGMNGATPYHTGGFDAFLRLPASITNVTVGELQVGVGGGAYAGSRNGSEGVLEFAAGSQLTSFNVTNSFWMGAWHADAGSIVGLPTSSWDLNLGTPSQPIPLYLGHKNHEGAYNVFNTSTGIFSPTNATVSAHLSSLVLGVCSNTSSYGPTVGVLDLTQSTLDALDVASKVVIGYSTCTYAGLSQGYLRLPQGTATTGDLLMGYGVSLARAYGEVELNGTQLTVTNQCTLFGKGFLTNHMAGVSGGLDILSSDTNNFEIQSGGLVHLKYEANPDDQKDTYWSLRMAGDQITHFEWLNAQGRLTWDTSGLDVGHLPRFGIHYSTYQDKTYVGLREMGGTLILVN